MKLVTFQDDQGRRHKSLIRDNDTDPTIGLIQSPPDLSQLDWQAMQVNLHNALLDKGILTVSDAQDRVSDFNQCVLAAIGKPLFSLYQMEALNNG